MMIIFSGNILTANLFRTEASTRSAGLSGQLPIWAAALVLAMVGAAPPVQARPQTPIQVASVPTNPIASDASGQDASKPHPEFENDEDGSKLIKRMEWFYGQRRYPLDHLPPRARLNALKQKAAKDAAEAAAHHLVGHRPVTQPVWTSIGPQPINECCSNGPSAGRTTALAIDPTNTQVIYAGAVEGGVWKTTNGGTTWIPLTDSQVSLATGSIAIDPQNHNTIYVGTGEANFSIDSYYGAGVLKSTDGGATWTLSQGPFGFNDACSNASIGAIAVQPSNSNVVLAGTEYCGLFRSTDGGATWSQPATVPNNIAANSIIFDPSTPTTVYGSFGYIFGGGTPGVYKSTNSGATWALMNGSGSTILPAGGREILALAASSSSTLYVGIQDPVNLGNLLGMWKSTDGANTWTQLTNAPNYCIGQCWYDMPLAVSPVNPNVIYTGGGNSTPIFVSLDGGNTWTEQDHFELHVDEHAFAFTPDGSTLYCAGDGGVWETTNPTGATVTWSGLNTTFATAEFYPGLSINPSNVNNTFGGTQDNDTEEYTGSPEWNVVTCGDGGATAIDFVNPLNVYANCIQLSLLKSTDGGMTFNTMQNGFGNDPTAWTPPLVMDPENSTTLYFGTNHAYQTTNGAALWTEISPDLTNGSNSLSSIAVAPSDSNTVYTGSYDGTPSVTRNALSGVGATWTNISSATELPNRAITAVAVDPSHPTTAYYTFSGFTQGGDTFGHVFMTTNAGASWTDISGDLPNTPVNSILVDPDVPGTIFIGTDIGAFYTTTTGGSWSTLGTGLPNVVVTGLALHNPTRTLRASTHGRSMWDLDIASLIPVPTITSLSPPSVIAGGSSFTLTVNGDQFDSQSVVQWNGTGLASTFVSSAEVTATVPASDIANAAIVQVSILNADSGEVSNSVAFDVDNPVPSASSLSPTSVLAGSGQFTLTVNGSSFVSTSVVQWNGGALATTYVNSGKVTATVPAGDVATAGTVSVTVMNPSPGGGTSGALTFTIDNPAPSASSLSPSSANAGGAQFTLTVNGSNFVASSSVHWNSSSLSTTFVNSGKVTATVPASDIAYGGTVSVTVVNPAPGGGTSNGLTFTINNPAPTATSIGPSSATAGGSGFILTVHGSNFVKTSAVQWNGSGRNTTYVNSAKVTAMITASDIALAGTFPVTVMNPAPGGGTSNAITFTVKNPKPTATSLSPNNTLAGGAGFTLMVIGTNFVTTSVVDWNGSSLGTTYVNKTKVTAMVPASDIANAGTANVQVKNPAPGGGASGTLVFTINNPMPTTTSLSPNNATAGGPSFTLTVNGTNFESKSKVEWNGADRSTTFVSATKLTAMITGADIATAGTASVKVFNASPGGGTSNAQTFTINNPAPALTSLMPNKTAHGGSAFTLTVHGSGFVTTSQVKWNGSNRTTTYVSKSQVKAAITAADIANAGTASVTVVNPSPGGGASNPLTFTIQ